MMPKSVPGKVDWELLKSELNELPKEKLVEMVSMWIENYWVVQSYWVTYVERDFGVDNATRLDAEVFKKSIKVQVKKLIKLLGLGNDMQTLAFVLKHTTPQWTPAGFDWEFTEVTDKVVKLQVHACPMGTYRKANDLELFPCKQVSGPLYDALAKAVNPKITATCTHAHPDPPIEGLNCSWEFVMED